MTSEAIAMDDATDDERGIESGVRALTLLLSAPVSARARRAHDMKNLVSCVAAIAALLERDSGDQARERIARLRDVSARLCELVKGDLVDDAPLPAARRAETFCVLDLARGVVTRALDRAARGGVRLQLLGEPAELRGERDTLDQALENLVGNAIDATPPGGTVVVSTRLTTDGDHEWLVRDTGCGISREQLAELGRVRCSRKEGGSGFGLVIALNAIAAHGGLLGVESCEGRGTTFTVFLPATRDADAGA